MKLYKLEVNPNYKKDENIEIPNQFKNKFYTSKELPIIKMKILEHINDARTICLKFYGSYLTSLACISIPIKDHAEMYFDKFFSDKENIDIFDNVYEIGKRLYSMRGTKPDVDYIESLIKELQDNIEFYRHIIPWNSNKNPYIFTEEECADNYKMNIIEAKNPFMDEVQYVKELINKWIKNKTIIIGFTFDTICSKEDDSIVIFKDIITLLDQCAKLNAVLSIKTPVSRIPNDEVVKTLLSIGLDCNVSNLENYDILIDNKCGLKSSYNILITTVITLSTMLSLGIYDIKNAYIEDIIKKLIDERM